MPKMTNLIPTRFARECATGGFIESCQEALSSLVEADSSRTALAVLGGAVGGPAAFLAIYGGMAFLQWKRDEREAEAAKAQFRELHRRLGRIEEGVNEQKEFAGMLAELLKRDSEMRERLDKAERSGTAPEQAFEALLKPMLTELLDDMEEGFEGVRIYLSNISTWVVEGFERIEAGQAVTHAKLGEIKGMLTDGHARLPGIPEGVRDNLTQAGVRPNPDFVGREDLIVRVHAALSGEGATVLTHALSAEGGVGKTEVAVAYVFDTEYAKTWEGIWWLDASAIGIEQSLIRALGVMGYGEADKLDPEQRRAEFVRRLGEGRHLVVLDNLDDRATLAGLTVPASSRVLATTRLSKEKLPPALANTINVEVFAPEDSARLLVKHRDDLRDEATGLPLTEHADIIATIAKELDQHGLAVALTAAALRVDRGVTPGALLERLREAEIGAKAHPFTELEADDTGRNYGLKVAASLLLHLPTLEAEMELVVPVLLLASCCHAEGIPFTVLAACMKAEEREVRKAVRALHDRSIVRFDSGVGVDKRGLLDIHRLTQSAVRQRAGEEAVDAAAEAVVEALNRVLTKPDDPERWAIQSEALPHAQAVLAVQTKDTAARAVLLNQSAFLHQTLGRAGEAEPLYVEALEMRQRLFKSDHPDVALSLNNLAIVRQALGRAAEAEPMSIEALEMTQRLFAGDHPDVARSLGSLAGVRNALDRAAEAEPLFAEALEMFKRVYPGDHPHVATSLNNLAGVRNILDRAADAEPLFAEALEMYQRLYEGDHPNVATSLNNLAYVRNALGRATEAEPLFVEALEMAQRLFEGDHPDVARSLNNLAHVRGVLGTWAEALDPSEEAVAMAGRCMPEGHPDRVLWERNLAFIRAELGGG